MWLGWKSQSVETDLQMSAMMELANKRFKADYKYVKNLKENLNEMERFLEAEKWNIFNEKLSGWA